MEHINNSLNWFEIPVTDFERARKFYSTIYDFEMPSVVMGENQLGFFPVEAKHIGGAIISGEECIPIQTGTLVYLNGGSDLNTILNRVESAGGKVILPKTNISPEHGFFATFIDTEGNKVALHSME
jgi:predicted enzyme related to lactoylglutathione lyase